MQLPQRQRSVQKLRTPRPCTGVKISEIRKRGFRGRRTPVSLDPEKGQFESENPHFSTGHHRENGDFLTQTALFPGLWEMGAFRPRNPLFLISEILTPVQGRGARNTKVIQEYENLHQLSTASLERDSNLLLLLLLLNPFRRRAASREAHPWMLIHPFWEAPPPPILFGFVYQGLEEGVYVRCIGDLPSFSKSLHA